MGKLNVFFINNMNKSFHVLHRILSLLLLKNLRYLFTKLNQLLYRQKFLREENVLRGKSHNFRNFFFCNNIIFHNSFSSCNLYSKGSNRRPSTYYFFLIFWHTPMPLPPAPYSKPPCLLFFRICSSQKKFFIHIDWYTCKILLNLVNFPYFSSCLGLVFIRRDQTDPILARLFKFHPVRFSSPFIKYLEKFHPTRLFHPFVY